MTEPVALPITEASQVGEARRAATALAGRLGFDETARGKVALVATEAATNLVKHAGGGELVLRTLERGRSCGLEILALDRGPGMADVSRCLADGFSTAGSSGNGLGAMSRLGDEFDIHSAPGLGCAVAVRLWSDPHPARRMPGRWEVGAVCLPKRGEAACGDAWATVELEGRWLVLVADGLGHGPLAAAAAREAVRVFHEQAAAGPAEVMRAAHAALRSTRGAVVGVAEVDPERRCLTFVGVGNVAGVVATPGAGRSLVSHNGTVGHEARKIQEFTYPWPQGALLVMHSDGLASHWSLESYRGLADRDAGLIAGVLYRDFRRDRDDVTVVVARECPEEGRP
jgi:anti-sigma regulatory factor (Ser/Thr protein kinase)